MAWTGNKWTQQRRISRSEKIRTHIATVYGMGELEVEVGTSGYDGGDGSRTYIRIEDKNGGTMIDADTVCSYKGARGGIEMKIYGDSEIDQIKEALRFILEILEEECPSDASEE